MAKLISPDSRFYESWNNAANLVLVNLLTLLCSIPIVTAGAAFAATARVAGEMVREEDTYILRSWIKAFRSNFKQATAGWVPSALFLIGFWYEERLLGNISHAFINGALLGVILAGVSIVLAFLCWFFPLISRYENSLKLHLHNTFRLMIGRFPLSLLCVFLCFLPVLVLIYLPGSAFAVGAFMTLIGISFIAYLVALIQKSTFDAVK